MPPQSRFWPSSQNVGIALSRSARVWTSSHFFVTKFGTRLRDAYVYRVFWALSRQIGIRSPGTNRGPRLHDFRHRFAIETLLHWYRAGEDVERR